MYYVMLRCMFHMHVIVALSEKRIKYIFIGCNAMKYYLVNIKSLLV